MDSLSQPPPFVFRLAAEAASIREARRAVKEHLRRLDPADEQLDRAELAVSEAVTNAVRHAYPEAAGGQVEVEVRSDRDCFHVHVRDWGCGQSQARRETAGTGLGMPLMQALSEEFALSDRMPQGTEVRMTFPLSERKAPVPRR